MVLLDKCCLCLPLRSGCIVLAYFYMVVTLSSALKILMETFFEILVTNDQLLVRVEEARNLEGVLNGILVVLLFAAFFFSVILIFGLHRDEPLYVKIFLIYTMVFLISYAVIFVIKSTNKIGNVIEGFIYLVLGAYLFFIAGSYYVKARDNKPSYKHKILL